MCCCPYLSDLLAVFYVITHIALFEHNQHFQPLTVIHVCSKVCFLAC